MCACATAKRRRKQSRLHKGRKRSKFEMKAIMIAKSKRR